MTGVGGQRHPALEWLVRRRDGESLTLIAERDGVSPHVVKRATAPFGPFPRATHYPGKALLPNEVVDGRTERWVQARRNGTSVKALARRDGVSHQLVSRCTVALRPLPLRGRHPAVGYGTHGQASRRSHRQEARRAHGAGTTPHPPMGPVPARACPVSCRRCRRQRHRPTGRHQQTRRPGLGANWARPRARLHYEHWSPRVAREHHHQLVRGRPGRDLSDVWGALHQSGTAQCRRASLSALYPSRREPAVPSTTGRDNNLLARPRILASMQTNPDIALFCVKTPIGVGS